MLRKLDGLLAPAADNMRPAWRVADVLGTWYRWAMQQERLHGPALFCHALILGH
jgi:hypothetical protein